MKQLDNFIFEKLKLNKDIKINDRYENWSIENAEEGDFIKYADKELYFIFDSLNTNHYFSDTLSENTIIYKAVYNAKIKAVRINLETGIGDTSKDFSLAPNKIKEEFIKALENKGYEWDDDKKELNKVN